MNTAGGASHVAFVDLGIAPNGQGPNAFIWVLHEGPDGRIYGSSSLWNHEQASFFIYDPETRVFVDKGSIWGSLKVPGSIVTGPDGMIYLATHVVPMPGGGVGTEYFTRYDPVSDEFTTIRAIYGSNMYITLGKDGNIYGAIGGSIFRYNPADGGFAENIASLSGECSAIATGTDGKIYFGEGGLAASVRPNYGQFGRLRPLLANG